jgi:hypothetical protein
MAVGHIYIAGYKQAKSNSHLYVVPATNLELQYYSRANERSAYWS